MRKMSRHARPHPALFLRLRPIGLALRGHLLPKGEGHARGFSLINVLNSYVNGLAAIVRLFDAAIVPVALPLCSRFDD